MKSVVQILKSKPDQVVYTVELTATVFDAAALMQLKNIGALLVLKGGRVVGIVTERDIACKMVLAGRLPTETPVRDIMHSPVQCVHPRHTNGECMALMTQGRLRHLPVIDDDRLIGLVSIGDLVKDIISEQEFIIHQLEHYIAGDRG
ncbi:MAG: CBS domain-containing protein [Burkholderiales bacterium]